MVQTMRGSSPTPLFEPNSSQPRYKSLLDPPLHDISPQPSKPDGEKEQPGRPATALWL
jgi:hypothetical protein